MEQITRPTHELARQFVQQYGVKPLMVEAPGRVNRIGEHTDYNDGFVLPAAIQFLTRVAIARRSDRRLVIASENYSEQVEFEIKQLPATARPHWSDYEIGVARKLEERGIDLPGANLLIAVDVPMGAGLSSSTSLEVAAYDAFLAISNAKLDAAEMARLCPRAENEFVGPRCGIMDQFVSVREKGSCTAVGLPVARVSPCAPTGRCSARDLQHDGAAQPIRCGIQPETAADCTQTLPTRHYRR